MVRALSAAHSRAHALTQSVRCGQPCQVWPAMRGVASDVRCGQTLPNGTCTRPQGSSSCPGGLRVAIFGIALLALLLQHRIDAVGAFYHRSS